MSRDYHTPLPFQNSLQTAALNSRLGQIDQTINDLIMGVLRFNVLAVDEGSLLTISAGGAITKTGSRHRVDTNGGAGSDDLDTISGGTAGDILFLSSVSASRVVTLRHNVGNLFLAAEENLVLDDPNLLVMLVYHAGVWSDSKGGGQPSGGGAMSTLVARTTLGAGAATIVVMSSIPATYSLLIAELELRTNVAALDDDFLIELNDDTTAANYHSGSASLTTSYLFEEALGSGANGLKVFTGANGNTAPANTLSHIRVVFPNYASASLNKTVRWQGMTPRNTTNGNLVTVAGGGRWGSTNAITKIELLPVGGTQFAAGSAYALYGVL